MPTKLTLPCPKMEKYHTCMGWNILVFQMFNQPHVLHRQSLLVLNSIKLYLLCQFVLLLTGARTVEISISEGHILEKCLSCSKMMLGFGTKVNTTASPSSPLSFFFGGILTVHPSTATEPKLQNVLVESCPPKKKCTRAKQLPAVQVVAKHSRSPCVAHLFTNSQ